VWSGFFAAHAPLTCYAPPLTLLGELTALPRSPSWFKGALLLRERGEQRMEKGRVKKGRRGEERSGVGDAPNANSWIRPTSITVLI